MASYDHIAEDYERRTASVSVDYAQFRSAYVSALRVGGTIADLGCGPGRDALGFRQAGLAVVGVDASLEMAKRARAKGVRIVVGDLRAAPLRRSLLDGVCASASPGPPNGMTAGLSQRPNDAYFLLHIRESGTANPK